MHLLHLWQADDWQDCDSSLLCVEFADKILIFAVLERCFLQQRDAYSSVIIIADYVSNGVCHVCNDVTSTSVWVGHKGRGSLYSIG